MIEVKRTGKTWSIFVDHMLVEGGFFTRHAAYAASVRDYEPTCYATPDCDCPKCVSHYIVNAKPRYK